MVGRTIHHCNRCDYKSDRRWNVERHFLKMHQNLSSSPDNVVERSQQFPLQQPSQHSLPNIDVPALLPVWSGLNEVAYSDNVDDTLTEYSSHGKQHDFFDAESDSESDTESGEVLEIIIDEIEEEFDNIIKLRGRFRGFIR